MPFEGGIFVIAKCLSSTLKVFDVMGKSLSGKLFCMRTGLVIRLALSFRVAYMHSSKLFFFSLKVPEKNMELYHTSL